VDAEGASFLMSFATPRPELTPTQFELFVRDLMERSSHCVEHFETKHAQKLRGSDGEYEIDVFVAFRVMGAEFRVLVECKHHRTAIKRDVVQVLADKVRSLGAQKGMLFSTSNFQVGAIEYAEKHGIALVRVTDSGQKWVRRQLLLSTICRMHDSVVGVLVRRGDRSGLTPTLYGSGFPGSIDWVLFGDAEPASGGPIA